MLLTAGWEGPTSPQLPPLGWKLLVVWRARKRLCSCRYVPAGRKGSLYPETWGALGQAVCWAVP